jgi:hypothetical protein
MTIIQFQVQTYKFWKDLISWEIDGFNTKFCLQTYLNSVYLLDEIFYLITIIVIYDFLVYELVLDQLFASLEKGIDLP